MQELIMVAKDIGSLVGTTLSCITLATVAIRPLRTGFVRMIERHSGHKEISEQIQELSEKFEQHTIASEKRSEALQESVRIVQEGLADVQEGNAAVIGDMIRQIYNEHRDSKTLSEREYTRLCHLYQIYHDKYHANGVIERLFNEMAGEGAEWEIVVNQ